MNHETLKTAFLQGSDQEASELFNEMMRKSVRLGLLEALKDEVQSLCGPKYSRENHNAYRRAGSEKAVAYINGTKEEILRPRVRHDDEGEVVLDTYKAASNQRNLFEDVASAMLEGLSSRSVERHTNKAVSKSAASRAWVERSQEQLEKLRGRDLSKFDFLIIQIDGVSAGELMILMAVGIDIDGNKHALDFEIGSSESKSESKAVVEALLDRLIKRGVKEPERRRLLVVRDGSQAIASAVSKKWPNALQQECLVHQERNVLDKLRRRDRAEGIIHFKRLRDAQGKEAGEEAFEELLDFVSERNAAAALVLKERADVLLSVHRLEVPSTLNVTLLSTNIIENMNRNWRAATGNVKLWKEKNEMAARWAAAGMLWSEAGFRKVRGYRDLGALAASLAEAPASSLTLLLRDLSQRGKFFTTNELKDSN